MAAYGKQMFRIQTDGVQSDYLVCRIWDGQTEGSTDVNVAKPWLLRQTPFDDGTRTNGLGQSIAYAYSDSMTRVATGPSGDMNEVIKPSWVEDDVIIATTGITGGTGVEVDDVAVVWLDDNNDARCWATSDSEPS
jgi:hypothetical protein